MTTWQLVVIAFVSGMAGAWVAQVFRATAHRRAALEKLDLRKEAEGVGVRVVEREPDADGFFPTSRSIEIIGSDVKAVAREVIEELRRQGLRTSGAPLGGRPPQSSTEVEG